MRSIIRPRVGLGDPLTSAIPRHRISDQLISLCQWRPNSDPSPRHHALPVDVASLPHLHPLLHLAALAAPPACFTAECQRNKDALFLASLLAPVLLLAGAAAWMLRSRPEDESATFSDPVTGVVFESPEGLAPEVDARGDLAFKPVGYTPWPVEEGAEGERVRVKVGAVGATQPRTFVLEKVLPQPSELLAVTLPRPLGVIFEEQERHRRVVVAELLPGGHAEQRRKRAAVDPSQAKSAVLEGDVLRAVTATTISYPTRALLFGAQAPQRCIVLYCADGKRWPEVITALKRGLVADGEVTVVVERPMKVEHARPPP